MPKAAYNCLECPGYCCSYPVVRVNNRDVKRLAKRFGLDVEVARKKFTKSAYGEKQIMRRQKDEHFGRICMLFDRTARRCTVYGDRPEICRKFPRETRCGYYDFLTFERRHQSDPDYVATTSSEGWP